MERYWDDFRIFSEVARSQSVAVAAGSLMISVATVRRRVDALESSLGTQLFDRQAGVFLPTQSASDLLAAVEAMETISRDAVERLKDRDHHMSGVVRLGAPDGIATVLLAPLLADLQQKHPSLVIEVVGLNRAADLRHREVDLAIVWDRPARGDHRIRALRPMLMRLYATAAYLERSAQAIGSIDDLENHRFITYPPASPMAQSLTRHLSPYRLSLRPQFTSSNVLVQASAAAAGGGIVLLPKYVAQQHSILIGILHDLFSMPFPTWLLVHNDAAGLARVRAVADVVYKCFANLDSCS